MDQISLARPRAEVLVNDFVRSVYNWMGIGLALTGIVALYVSNSPTLIRLFLGNPILLFVLIFGELGLVFSISGMINRMSAGTATSLFILYSGLNGITLSSIFLIYTRTSIVSTFFVCAAIYTRTSIVSTFFVCAATFVACSIYGWTTKRDLASFGGFLVMGLIGIIIASLVNMFVHSSGLGMLITYIGVFVFLGLTAYDTQRIKEMALTQPAGLDAGVVRKGAILGALSLYLDFINLFLLLLRFFGQTRE